MFIEPVWPAPKTIHAYTTLRSGGVSKKPFDQFNLAQHVGDDEGMVAANREILKNALQLPNEPIWIKQTHSTIAILATEKNTECEADASFTHEKNQICVVLTADCLPILVCNKQGTSVAAIHAGWRGLLNGVIESTLEAMKCDPEDLLIWLGPAISQAHFEVGDEVRAAFLEKDSEAHSAFIPSPNQRFMADLYLLATQRLHKRGIQRIFGGNYCTYSDANQFYSYRRDGSKTGRMASLIWIAQEPA